MCRSLRRAMLLPLMFVASVAAAQEQATGAGRLEFGGFPGGGMLFAGSSGAAIPDFANYTLGASFTWNVNQWVGLETEAGFGIGGHSTALVDGQSFAAQPMPDTITYTGNVVINPVGNRREIVPYVTGGLGAFALVPRGGTAVIGVTDRQTMLTENLGGGVKWYATRGWGIRADYRLIMIDHHDEAPLVFGGEGTRYAQRVYGGVFATF